MACLLKNCAVKPHKPGIFCTQNFVAKYVLYLPLYPS